MLFKKKKFIKCSHFDMCGQPHKLKIEIPGICRKQLQDVPLCFATRQQLVEQKNRKIYKPPKDYVNRMHTRRN